jgi:undecaprenyl-diphosphatase
MPCLLCAGAAIPAFRHLGAYHDPKSVFVAWPNEMAGADQDLTSSLPPGAGAAPDPGQRVLWLLAGLTSCLFAALVVAVDLNKPYFPIDVQASEAVQDLSCKGLDRLMEWVSWAGEDFLSSFLIVSVSACVLLAARAPRAALILFVAIALEQIAVIGIKNLIARPRPSDAAVRVLIHAHEYYSFPSGHTVHYTVLFGLLTFLTWHICTHSVLRRLLCGGFLSLVLLVGPARIYLGAHWVTDVVGGYLLGGTILLIAIAVYRAWREA